MNVYGSEVTEATVKRQPGYVDGTPITAVDMAKLAMTMINHENKRDMARAYLKELEDKYGGVATKGLIYNATGETMVYVTKHDYDGGHFGDDSLPPSEIRNGQWGVFLHRKNSSLIPGVGASSEGAVVYRLRAMDCMMSWRTRSAGDGQENQCYAEIREKDHFDDSSVWQWYAGGSQWTETANPHQISSFIGDTTVCEYFAVVNLLH